MCRDTHMKGDLGIPLNPFARASIGAFLPGAHQVLAQCHATRAGEKLGTSPDLLASLGRVLTVALLAHDCHATRAGAGEKLEEGGPGDADFQGEEGGACDSHSEGTESALHPASHPHGGVSPPRGCLGPDSGEPDMSGEKGVNKNLKKNKKNKKKQGGRSVLSGPDGPGEPEVSCGHGLGQAFRRVLEASNAKSDEGARLHHLCVCVVGQRLFCTQSLMLQCSDPVSPISQGRTPSVQVTSRKLCFDIQRSPPSPSAKLPIHHPRPCQCALPL